MAPVKPATQESREKSVRSLLTFLSGGRNQSTATLLESVSEVKGLFNRVARADQWDWFTVWLQLGRPSPTKLAPYIATALGQLRKALVKGDHTLSEVILGRLNDKSTQRCLRSFLEPHESPHAAGRGYVYVLSTRETPGLLKIGYTNRDIVTRVNEINRATGVVYPYGVRALWVVSDAADVERQVHDLLGEYRVRKDREFFAMEFGMAVREITRLLKSRDIERG